MTQTVCVPTAEADVLLKLASLLRPGPPVHKEILTPGPSARVPESGPFRAPVLHKLTELYIVIPPAGRDY